MFAGGRGGWVGRGGEGRGAKGRGGEGRGGEGRGGEGRGGEGRGGEGRGDPSRSEVAAGLASGWALDVAVAWPSESSGAWHLEHGGCGAQGSCCGRCDGALQKGSPRRQGHVPLHWGGCSIRMAPAPKGLRDGGPFTTSYGICRNGDSTGASSVGHGYPA